MSKEDENIYGKQIKVSYELLTVDNANMLLMVNCGNEALDGHIQSHCANDYSMVTKLILNSKNNDLIGIYSLSASNLIWISHGKHYEAPAIELKFFVINSKYQDMPYSEDKEDGCLSSNILSYVINDIMNFTDNFCGANFITLYSTDIGLKFYLQNGFQEFPSETWKNDDRFLEGCTPLLLRIRP